MWIAPPQRLRGKWGFFQFDLKALGLNLFPPALTEARGSGGRIGPCRELETPLRPGAWVLRCPRLPALVLCRGSAPLRNRAAQLR